MKLNFFILTRNNKSIHVDIETGEFWCFVGNMKFTGNDKKEMKRLAQMYAQEPVMRYFCQDEWGARGTFEWEDLSDENRKRFADFCNNA